MSGVVILILIGVIGGLVFYLWIIKKQVKDIDLQILRTIQQHAPTDIRVSGYLKELDTLSNSLTKLVHQFKELEINHFKAKENNQQMIASIAHDFRTPLTAILGYILLLKEDNLTSVQLKYLEIVEKRLSNLSLLVEDFYLISTLDSQEYPVKFEAVSPSLVLQEVLASYYHELEAHFKEIDLEIDERDYYVASDVNVLIRIFSNLLKNALSYGKDYLRIRLYYQKNLIIEIENKVEDATALIGQDLFKRNFKLNNKYHTTSTGLGLSICRDLSKLINSSIISVVNGDNLLFRMEFK